MPLVKGQTFGEYRKAKGYNQSSLKPGKYGDWRKVKWLLDGHDSGDSDSRVRGRLTHTALLQPDLIEDEFELALPRQRRDEESTKTHVSHSIHTGVFEMTNVVHSTPEFKTIISSGEPEVSIYWDDSPTLLPLKGRLDWYCEKRGLIADIKTSSASVSPFSAARTIASKGYDSQAAWYVYGLKELGYCFKEFVFIFIETKAPFTTAFYRMTDKDLNWAHEQNMELVKRLKACIDTDQWPSFVSGITDLSIPEEFKRGVEVYELED